MFNFIGGVILRFIIMTPVMTPVYRHVIMRKGKEKNVDNLAWGKSRESCCFIILVRRALDKMSMSQLNIASN